MACQSANVCVGGDCEGVFPKVLRASFRAGNRASRCEPRQSIASCNRADVRLLIVSVKIASAASGSWCWFTTSAQSPLRPNNATSSSLALVQ